MNNYEKRKRRVKLKVINATIMIMVATIAGGVVCGFFQKDSNGFACLLGSAIIYFLMFKFIQLTEKL